MATKKKTTATKPAIAAKPRPAAVETKTSTTSLFVPAGAEVVKDLIAASTQEAQRAQEKVLSFGREHVEKWTSGADKTARSFTESFALSKDNVDALTEFGKIASTLGKEYQEEVVAEWNAACAETVETAKELLACRTLNDYVELQNRAVQAQLNRAVATSARLTDLWFKLTTEATEPLNSQVNRTTSRLNKVLAA